jgi:hypothetical protein
MHKPQQLFVFRPLGKASNVVGVLPVLWHRSGGGVSIVDDMCIPRWMQLHLPVSTCNGPIFATTSRPRGILVKQGLHGFVNLYGRIITCYKWELRMCGWGRA